MANKTPSTSFVCSNCGYDSPKWFGKCPGCGEWNTMVEFHSTKSKNPHLAKASRDRLNSNEKPRRLSEINKLGYSRISTGIEEFDRVTGGGLVTGSVILLAGEPGVGKSTLLLELVRRYGQTLGSGPVPSGMKPDSTKQTLSASFSRESDPFSNVLYASGEESVEQIKGRAERLGVKGENLYLLAETNVDTVLDEVSQVSKVPQVTQAKSSNIEARSTKEIQNSNDKNSNKILLIIDSIQTMYSDQIEGIAGSVSQVKYCTQILIELAKKTNITIILIGHVTKEGEVAGPMMLAHMVDVVLFLEGERYADLRLLRGIKNRFGATDEVGVFRMDDKGMGEVKNPSEVFLRERVGDAGEGVGSVTTCTMEGTRPILTEIQALVTKSYSPMPRRVGMGIDNNRLNLLTAVLQKILKLPLWDQDIFVKVAGGFKISEPAADLAICHAIISSFKNVPVPAKTAVFGEVGLLGEVRWVSGEEKRVKEANKLGFSKVLSSVTVKSIRGLP